MERLFRSPRLKHLEQMRDQLAAEEQQLTPAPSETNPHSGAAGKGDADLFPGCVVGGADNGDRDRGGGGLGAV